MARQKVVGRVSRTVTTVMKEKVKEYRYHTVSRKDVRVDTYYGYRLSCGHAVDGERAHGKNAIDCLYCDPDWSDCYSGGDWVDLPPEN